MVEKVVNLPNGANIVAKIPNGIDFLINYLSKYEHIELRRPLICVFQRARSNQKLQSSIEFRTEGMMSKLPSFMQECATFCRIPLAGYAVYITFKNLNLKG